MGKPARFGDLDLGFDPAHEEREWVAQRVGWLLMAVTVGAALAGLLGPGPLSKRTAGRMGSPLHVEYMRFVRSQAPQEIKLFCRPGNEAEFGLSLERTFIEHSEISEISPQPITTSAEGDRYVFTFKRISGDEQLVTFRIEGTQFGRAGTKVALNGGETVELRQFYWP